MTNFDGFFDAGYDYNNTSSNGGIFFKLQDGANTVRILKPTDGSSACAAGFCWWLDTDDGKRPCRGTDAPNPLPENIALSTQYGNKPEIKAVWICAVINRATGRLQLWEISQSTIKDAIVATAQAVGNPCNYDIVVTRTKKSGKVSYTVTPTTPASLSAADQTLVSGYAIQPGKMFSGGKGLENISDSEAAAVPTPPDNIEALLRKALVDDEMTPERVAQLEEWALGYLTQFDAIAGAGNGGDLIASILNPYKVEAPAASVPLPVAPAAPTKALVGAGAAVDDIPF